MSSQEKSTHIGSKGSVKKPYKNTAINNTTLFSIYNEPTKKQKEHKDKNPHTINVNLNFFVFWT